MATLRSLCILVFAALAASRRGAPPPPPIPENDWAVRHLAEEHHVDNYNAGAFFLLHDFDSSGGWSHAEVRRLYGLDDESNKDVPEARKQEALDTVFRLFDDNGNGVIERDEFTRKDAAGARLPDVGMGPGHHGDDEYEYEIHHFEKFHNENTKEEDLTHPEDIAHFAKHEREEQEAAKLEQQNQKPINVDNIPQRFRRRSF